MGLNPGPKLKLRERERERERENNKWWMSRAELGVCPQPLIRVMAFVATARPGSS